MTVMTVKQKSTDDEKKTTDRQFRRGKPVQFYAEDDLIARVDDWRAAQRPVLTRSEAIRHLLKTNPDMLKALSSKGGKKS
jgi:hypothetical protein